VNVVISETDSETESDMTPLAEESAGGIDDVIIGQQLTPAQKEQIRRLLTEYKDVFSDKPGHTNLTQHVITLKEGDQTPIFENSYRIPDALRNPVENELKRMLQNGIIKYDPNTNYNNPLVIVKKSDGGIRLVNNFISLNKRTVDDRCQMPNANELLSRVAGESS